MLELINIKKAFNRGTINEKKALNGVNIKLDDGDFVTIIGGNGSRKIHDAERHCGRVAGGRRLHHHQRQERHRTFRAPARKVHRQSISGPHDRHRSHHGDTGKSRACKRRGEGRFLKWGITRREREEYHELLKMLDLGLEDRMSSKVGLLSGGQRQALTLLVATLKKPQILLLDEHTAALDPKTAAKVLQLSDEIIAKNHLTAMMVTHNMANAIEYGNRLIMMNDGKIIYDVKGEEKKKLTVDDLLQKFEEASGSALNNDRMLLSGNK